MHASDYRQCGTQELKSVRFIDASSPDSTNKGMVRRYVFEMIPDFARNVISGFARLGGETVGVIANNPLVLAGVLDIDAAIKASRCVDQG